MNLFFKNKYNFTLTITTILISLIIIVINYKDQINCNNASEYKSILKCVDKPYMDEKEKISYLNSKNTILKKINLTEYQSIEYENNRLIVIYSSLKLFMSKKDKDIYLDLIKPYIKDDLILTVYIEDNEDISKIEKIEMLQKYININGLLLKKDNSQYSYSYLLLNKYKNENK